MTLQAGLLLTDGAMGAVHSITSDSDDKPLVLDVDAEVCYVSMYVLVYYLHACRVSVYIGTRLSRIFLGGWALLGVEERKIIPPQCKEIFSV